MRFPKNMDIDLNEIDGLGYINLNDDDLKEALEFYFDSNYKDKVVSFNFCWDSFGIYVDNIKWKKGVIMKISKEK